MTEEFRNVRLPSDLCSLAENKFGHRHGGLEGFLIFVLQELTRDAARMDQVEQSILEQRLRDLGYL